MIDDVVSLHAGAVLVLKHRSAYCLLEIVMPFEKDRHLERFLGQFAFHRLILSYRMT